MPRANRHFLPGQFWHITHRCHEQNFLLKFARDRRRYLHWLFEARKRFGLYFLNYVVTSKTASIYFVYKSITYYILVPGTFTTQKRCALGRTLELALS
jgi:hypothetical protein